MTANNLGVGDDCNDTARTEMQSSNPQRNKPLPSLVAEGRGRR